MVHLLAMLILNKYRAVYSIFGVEFVGHLMNVRHSLLAPFWSPPTPEKIYLAFLLLHTPPKSSNPYDHTRLFPLI